MIQRLDSANSGSSQDEPRQQDYLPARMINEFVYCPRLFFLEHVEGLFAHNADTIDGAIKHKRVDQSTRPLPKAPSRSKKSTAAEPSVADQADAQDQDAAESVIGPMLHARSVTLASDQYHILAKLDLVEAQGDVATPVDYKRGRPRLADDGSPEAWEPEQVQVCVQALVLRDNGYRCDQGIIYYAETKQRIPVPISDQLVARTLEAIAEARRVMASGQIPPPLVESPKCPRCSLVGICLPDESLACAGPTYLHDGQGYLFDVGPQLYQIGIPEKELETGVRRLIAARDDRRPLYINTPGLTLSKSGEVLQIKEKGKTIHDVRMKDTSQVNLMGPIQISSQALQSLMQADIPVGFFSMGNWFYGITQGLGLTNIITRRQQFRLADDGPFCLRLARALVAGKIRNCRVLLMRNHYQVPRQTVHVLKRLERQALMCEELSSLLGIEGTAAAAYFAEFSGMLKAGQSDEPFFDDPPTEQAQGPLSFDFKTRNRRPPRDPVNALLSLAYSMLAKELTITCAMVGLDPYLGYYHQPRYGRPALALDLMEPFRPLIAESTVLTAVNSRMVQIKDFVQAGDAVALTPDGRKNFIMAFEGRMDTLVTHPLFGYRVSYRRVLEIQTRLLARMLCGEIGQYPVFVTR